jgi:predicted helicase
MLKDYIRDIFKTSKTGDATENSYYPDLKKLLETYLIQKGRVPNITVVAKKTTAGIPDFTIRRGHELIGYIEAKDPKYEDLDNLPARDTEQLARYKDKLPNLILTNYLDFWLWRKEEKRWVKKVRIGMPRVFNSLRMAPPAQKEDEFFDLLAGFFNFYIPERKSAKSLAEELAGRAQLLPPYILELLTDNKDEEIDRIYQSFTEFLIPDLSKEDFADIYAQTITYGLFTARLLSKNGRSFNRFEAQSLLPKNLPLLYHTFNLISSSALPESIEWLVTEITTVLANADMGQITKELNIRKGEEDPFVHFYEDFLSVYDPRKREKRGVYYTPFPVVSYITRSINEILKDSKYFGFKEGFADKNVTCLDFASGTLTFPVNSIKLAFAEYSKWNPDLGGVTGFIRNHILKDFYAFELLMAPYVLGHLKASLILREYGYNFNSSDKEDRFNLYLTNTLDFDPIKESNQPFTFYLSEEGKNALEVKKDKRILVVMGNPPYSVSSQNDTEFTRKEMGLYKEDVKDEKNIQLLSDDYVKFIRFAHWKIQQVGTGIIGVITKNTYLSVSAFKGLRKKLLEYFDDIYVLNLHGKLYEKTPEGKPDENVFDIRVGVSILFLIKNGKKKEKYADLYFAELRGDRESKYKYLSTDSINTTKWEKLKIDEEYFFFEKKDFAGGKIYKSLPKLTEIFNEKISGIKSGRDNFISDLSENKLRNKLLTFISCDLNESGLKSAFDLSDTSNLTVSKLKAIFKEIDDSLFFKFAFKPFSPRIIYYDRRLVDRDRYSLMKYFLKNDNLGLVIKKRFTGQKYNHAFVVDTLCDINFLQGQSYIFPLYLDRNNNNNATLSSEQQSLIEPDQLNLGSVIGGRKTNISGKFLSNLQSVYGKKPNPEDIFAYIYAVLNSTIYGNKYLNQLANDFPRIPFTANYDLFKVLAKHGKELTSLHLLKENSLEKPVAKFYGKDSESVEAKAVYKDKRIFINNTQYFGEVEKGVWQFCIGGYQVLDKWFKDRIGRQLDDEDIRHVCKVITAISKTLELQNEIDKLYPEVEKSLIKFS